MKVTPVPNHRNHVIVATFGIPIAHGPIYLCLLLFSGTMDDLLFGITPCEYLD